MPRDAVRSGDEPHAWDSVALSLVPFDPNVNILPFRLAQFNPILAFSYRF
jgi:hypothetical protein